MSDLLKIKNLNVSYGAIQALRDVSINVPQGSIVAILGANGGGKSSLLKKISGLIPAQSGAVIFDDKNITKTSPEKIAASGIVHVPEGRQIFGDLTVYENLMIGAFTVKKSKILYDHIHPSLMTPEIEALIKVQQKEKDDDEIEVPLTRELMIRNNLGHVYDYFPVLKERKNQMAESLSGGEQQMLAIGRALMGTPKLLILDEPSLGLAPMIVKSIFNIVSRLNKAGITVLIVEQNALQTLKIAHYAYVIQVGKIINQGSAEKLINDPELIEAYLGK